MLVAMLHKHCLTGKGAMFHILLQQIGVSVVKRANLDGFCQGPRVPQTTACNLKAGCIL